VGSQAAVPAAELVSKYWPAFQQRVSGTLPPLSTHARTRRARPRHQRASGRGAGEWEGTSTTFTAEGEPEPLPEHYVPQAFRDWAVELLDWHTQCSSLASGDSFQTTCRNLMPTVGCEADAIAFTEEGVELWSAGQPGAVLPVLPSGTFSSGEHGRAGGRVLRGGLAGLRGLCGRPPGGAAPRPPACGRCRRQEGAVRVAWSARGSQPGQPPPQQQQQQQPHVRRAPRPAGPQQLPEGLAKARLESCLQQGGGDSSSSRVRVVHNISRHWQSKQWCVTGVEVYRDKWVAALLGCWRRLPAPSAPPAPPPGVCVEGRQKRLQPCDLLLRALPRQPGCSCGCPEAPPHCSPVVPALASSIGLHVLLAPSPPPPLARSCPAPGRWDGPYRGLRELTACGYAETGFAKQEPLAAEQLQGSWEAVGGARYSVGLSGDTSAAELAAGEALAVGADGALLLPLGVWSRFSAQGDSVVAEAGRVLEGGALLLLARRSYVDGALAEVLLLEAARA
jgi:hypothetical protein